MVWGRRRLGPGSPTRASTSERRGRLATPERPTGQKLLQRRNRSSRRLTPLSPPEVHVRHRALALPSTRTTVPSPNESWVTRSPGANGCSGGCPAYAPQVVAQGLAIADPPLDAPPPRPYREPTAAASRSHWTKPAGISSRKREAGWYCGAPGRAGPPRGTGAAARGPVMPTWASRRSSSRLDGVAERAHVREGAVLEPGEKTTGNSKPLAVCRVARVTTPDAAASGESGISSASATRETRSRKASSSGTSRRPGACLVELASGPPRRQAHRGSPAGSRPAGPRWPRAGEIAAALDDRFQKRPDPLAGVADRAELLEQGSERLDRSHRARRDAGCVGGPPLARRRRGSAPAGPRR